MAKADVRKHPELTEEQEATLRTFRKELLEENIISEKGDSLGTQYDHILLRFLRARKFNLSNAKTMIKNCMEWRRTVGGVGIDELYRKIDPCDYPERREVFKYWPIWYHNTDKRGRPFTVESFGNVDVAELYKVVSPERFWEILVATTEGTMREILPGASYAAGRVIDESMIVADLQGFSLAKFWQMKSLVRDTFQMTQDYIPETLGTLIVINAPYGFATIWSIVKGWLAKETQEKVQILGSNYKEVLLEYVDAENLPAAIGGKCTCQGEGGCEFSNVGPWMIGRKERRQKWLDGEIDRPGLGLEDLENGSINGNEPELPPSLKF